MKTNPLKISTRLALGFGLTMLLGLSIALFASWEMRHLAADLHEVANERMVDLRELSVIANNQSTMARLARNVVLRAPGAPESDLDIQNIHKLREENARMMDHLQKVIEQPRGQELLKVIFDNRARYNADVDQAISLTQRGQREAAVSLLLGDSRIVQQQMAKAANDSIELQQQTAERIAKTSASAAAQDSLILFILVGILVIVGTTVAWLITRQLMRALGAEPAEVNLAVQRVAAGQLDTEVLVRAGDEVSTMASVRRMQEALRGIVGTVRDNADSVATASAEIAQGNADLSSRTEEQASALEETAASMEELGHTVQQNAESARQASLLSQEANTAATRGGEVVNQVVAAMKDISSQSNQISEIIGVINGIAFQTNILALNAAVEAARAGEQGRGFAVVASEVRVLAQRSAAAAKDIQQLIDTSVRRVEEGSAWVERAGLSMGEIVQAVQQVAEIVGQISIASTEQSTGVNQVGEAVTQMDQATQQNAALVEQSAAAAESLRLQAEQLVQAVAIFSLGGESAHHEVTQQLPKAAAKKSTRPIRQVNPQRSKTPFKVFGSSSVSPILEQTSRQASI